MNVFNRLDDWNPDWFVQLGMFFLLLFIVWLTTYGIGNG